VGVADVAVSGAFFQGGTSGAPVATRTLVSVTGQPITQAARISVQNPNGQYWSSSVSSPSTRAVEKDDVLLAHLRLRCISTTDETGSAFATIFVQGPSPSYTKSLAIEVRAGSDWVEYFIPFRSLDAYATGQFSVNVGFGAGARPQVLEIGGVEVLWYGKTRTYEEMPRTSFQYEGRAANAAWRAEAAARIEQYRKSNYELRVVNAGGLPVTGASVRVRLKRHAFPFGVAFESRFVDNQAVPAEKAYADKITELFNSGSTGNDLKWGPWIGEWGSSYGKPVALPALQMFKDRGFLLRGHVLVWPSFRNLPNLMQTPLQNTDPGVPKMITDHIHDEVTGARHLIDEWDVLNEPYDNHDVMDRYGNAVMVDWFKQARADHPGADLYINDYAILSGGGTNVAKQDFYENTVRYLLDNGAPVTGMGFQGHFDGAPTGMTKVKSIIDRYSTAFPAMKFKITEFDVNTDDDQLQADYTRDFLTLCFSLPRVAGFQFWGFWENDHWKKQAAMYKADWTEKLSGAAYRTLVKQTWMTDNSATSTADGRVQGRGFKGLYDVEVTVGGRTYTAQMTVGDGAAPATVTVDATVDGKPVFTREPLGLTVAPGEAATLSCEVAGLPAPTLAWYRNGQLLGHTAARLDIAAAALSDEGTYYIEATNSLGTVRSREFRLGVRSAAQRTGKMVNISTRGLVLSGQAKMVAGFVIKGTGSKSLLLRAVGPRLSDFGMGSVAGDPVMDLYRITPYGLASSNDDWDNSVAPLFASTGAFGLATDTKSSALSVSLAEGMYTTDFSDKAGAGGIGIAEAYDVSPDDALSLVNISTRGQVGTGQGNLVAGFCISGTVPKQVLIRGVGKPLEGFGLTGVLSNPHIVLHEILKDGPRVVTSNDDWFLNANASAISAAFDSTGAFSIPAYGNDACLLVWLEPGNYTITLSGADGGTGIAIVEVYAVP
jgi:GH35 family endo-1,4-beta-xylanase